MWQRDYANHAEVRIDVADYIVGLYNNIRNGDKVSFTDRYWQPQIGTSVRINQRTATVECNSSSWRVPFAMLHHVLDI